MYISEQEIKPYLRGALGNELKVFDVLDSTNNKAKLLAKNGAQHGSVILARQQTNGRGRLGRNFFSPKDAGIYLSIILRPTFTPEKVLLMTSAAAVAVCQAIKNICGLETKIKWVNDIYYNGKKLCGILTESSLGKNGVEYVVLGIGINLQKAAYPTEISDIAISLEETGITPNPNRLVAEIINQLDIYIQNDSFMNEYRSRSCVLGKEVHVICGNQEFLAIAQDFDANAHLIVITPEGEKKILCSGEISIRGNFI